MRILVVEDEKRIADFLSRGLESAGYAVDVAHDGSHAIDMVHTTEYDLAILDLGLPDMDGLTVLQKIRNRKVTPPVLILSARDAVDDRVKGLEGGADDAAGSKPESPASDRPAAASALHPVAPQIKIVSREADNPASVTTSPAPSLARKVMKRRKLAAHLRQSHHFRRPRIHQIAGAQIQGGYATGIVQPNAYQPAAAGYTTGTYAQSSGFAQPGCAQVDMSLLPVPGGRSPLHVTACPFVTPEIAKAAAERQTTASEGALS